MRTEKRNMIGEVSYGQVSRDGFLEWGPFKPRPEEGRVQPHKIQWERSQGQRPRDGNNPGLRKRPAGPKHRSERERERKHGGH